MDLFQPSVQKNYLKLQDKTAVAKAYKKYTKYFHNDTIQQNIRESKEEQFQQKFLMELFVNVFDYVIFPDSNHNLTTEFKNEKGAQKADGAILKDGKAIAVIELKGTKTKDLEKIRKQAFDYKANQSECVYVITSNFEKLRFYINDAVNHEEFNLFNLTEDRFELFYLCLHKDSILNNLPLKIKQESIVEEESITKKFYANYSLFKRELYRDLVKENMKNDVFRTELQKEDTENANKNIKRTLFKKSQKLIDRFLFIFFAEDRGLLLPNFTLQIIDEWKKLNDLDAPAPLYSRFKLHFDYLDTGRQGTEVKTEIFAYNGGLFKPDAILDSLIIDDQLLLKHTKVLSDYNFESQIDVNILGHIFENSLNEIESINAEIDGVSFDKQTTKRKKDGVFYTPKYITKYIVDSTVGKLCSEKKMELDIKEEDYYKARKGRTTKKLQELQQKLDDYRNWMLTLTILDPACGSGAFLNQALDFLIKEHSYIDELYANLLGVPMVLQDIENTVLEKNIFGVDINEESVEIAKLSLWLRTAQPRRKLNVLSNNIKCGNSLIDTKSVAGEKAFNWQNEFPEVFAKGRFDIIIGNPPYGAYLNENEKSFYQKNIKSFQGNFEIYFFFIEYCTNLIKENGILSFITPDTWIKIPQAQKLREYVISNYGINEIISFDYSVFHDASVNPIIFILSYKTFSEKCSIISIANIDEVLKLYSKSSLYYCTIKDWSDSQDKQFQIYQTDDLKKLLSKIKKDTIECCDLLDVSQGIVPYSKEHLSIEEIKSRIYHSKERIEQEYGMWVQGRAINRYSINLEKHEYLKYGSWLHRPRKQKYFQNERILIQEITGGNPPRISATKYNDVLYHDPGIISCLNSSTYTIEYILAILNSKLLSWYHVVNSPKGKRTTFPKVLIGDIRKLPIKKANNSKQNIFSKKVNSILNQSQLLLSEKVKFFHTLYEEKPEFAETKKMANFEILSFDLFKKELKKQKVEFSLGTENDKWRDYFNLTIEKIQGFQSVIDKIDKEIDQMVYELYGLTEEEIKIVEESQ